MMVMYAEAKKNGRWQKVGKVFDSWFLELSATDRVCDDIDELTFQVLSGIKQELHTTYTDFKTMQPHVGLPDDASDEIANNKYFVGRKCYYLNFDEIMSYDWDQDVYEIGYTTETQYSKLDKGNKPAIIRNFVNKDKNVVDSHEMDMIIKNPDLRNSKKYWVKVKYNRNSIGELCYFFYHNSIPRLYELASVSDGLRVIFTFIP